MSPGQPGASRPSLAPNRGARISRWSQAGATVVVVLATAGLAWLGIPLQLGALVGLNLAAFLLFGADKASARFGPEHGSPGGVRIPERVLLGVAALGAAPGALAAMQLFRHKTQKPLFKWGVPGLLFLQLGLFGFLAWRFPVVARRLVPR